MSDFEVGVTGGVGPAATAEFLARVVGWTDAATDQEHANLVVIQHSTIPDRTAFLVGESAQDPGPVLVSDARRLESWGVQAIVVPCNTASAFLAAMRAAVEIDVVDIIEAAAHDAADRGWGTVGVLATAGTMASGAYSDALAELGLRAIAPRPSAQSAVTALIYEDVKAGRPPREELFNAAVADVIEQGADGVVLGCTELSVAAARWARDRRVLDALDSLAVRTVDLAGRRLRRDYG